MEGYAELSKKRLDAVKIWENIETAVEEKTVLEGIVTEENKGGIVVSVKGIRVFVPASQSGQPRGADLSAMIKAEGPAAHHRGQPCPPPRGGLHPLPSLTRPARPLRRQVWSSIEVGKHYTGTVKSMTSYGVFVDIGGVDGMVHISELSWSRIKNPAEVCQGGRHHGCVRHLLRRREAQDLSGRQGPQRGSLGSVHEQVSAWATWPHVRIVKLMTFGAFAEVVPGVDGLIHISQIADRRIEKPERRALRGPDRGRQDHCHRRGEARRSPCPSALCWLLAADEEDAPVEE